MKIRRETEKVEFKKSLTERDDGYSALAAMLNKHGMGTVYIGVRDDGTVVGVQIGKNTLRTISQEIGNRIEPKIVPVIDVLSTEEGKEYIRIYAEGDDRPYAKDGEFRIRSGEENRKVPVRELRRLFQSCSDLLRGTRAFRQDLTFKELTSALEDNGFHVMDQQSLAVNMGLLLPDGSFSMQAELLSDQNNIPLTVVVFGGTDKTAISFRTDFSGRSLIKEMEQVADLVSSLNETAVDMSNPVRRDIRLFDTESFREAWINAVVHNTWTTGAPPTVHVFDDRIEIISNGSIPYGESEKDFFAGISRPVNESLMRIFINAGLSEHTGHGVPIIVREYGQEAFDINPGYVRVTLKFATLRSASRIRGKAKDPELSDNEMRLLSLLGSDPHMTMKGAAEIIGITPNSCLAIAASLRKKGVLRRAGSKKNGKWVVQME